LAHVQCNNTSLSLSTLTCSILDNVVPPFPSFTIQHLQKTAYNRTKQLFTFSCPYSVHLVLLASSGITHLLLPLLQCCNCCHLHHDIAPNLPFSQHWAVFCIFRSIVPIVASYVALLMNLIFIIYKNKKAHKIKMTKQCLPSIRITTFQSYVEFIRNLDSPLTTLALASPTFVYLHSLLLQLYTHLCFFYNAIVLFLTSICLFLSFSTSWPIFQEILCWMTGIQALNLR
jgi:hypothetical protein